MSRKWKNRSARLLSKSRFRRLLCEGLEPRLVLSASPLDFGGGSSPEWNESEFETIPGQWIARFSGIDGGAEQQIAALVERLSAAALQHVEVVQPLGLAGMFTLQSPPDYSYEDISEDLSAPRRILVRPARFNRLGRGPVPQ